MKTDPHRIVGRALTTEKSVIMREDHNRYAFEVAASANKLDIKQAVEELFKVTVLDVRTQNVRGKLKQLGRFSGRRPSWKKAIVKLKKGETLPLFENL
jgi:large subunit ribosomal protein L23